MSINPISVSQLNTRLRKWVYDLLFNDQIKNNLHVQFEHFITYVIVLNMAGLVLEHIPIIYDTRQNIFHFFDVISLIIFTIEYILRAYVAPENPAFKSAKIPRLAFFKSPFALIDLVSILPFYLGTFFEADLRVLRALRLLRLFKLFRALTPAVREFLEKNKGKSFRYKIYALVNDTPTSGHLHHIFDFFIVLWVIISVLAVILESVQSVNYYLHTEFIILDVIAVAVFSTEYLMRLYSCTEDPKYKAWLSGRLRSAKNPTNVIDLLAILPFYLESILHHLFDLRFLRVFRLMRLLKLARYSGATQSLFIVIKREWPVMKASAFIMMLLVMLAACLGYLFEHEAQPDKFENIPQSIYWSVVTLASVGYGDISPITPAGRAMTIVLALLGIGIFAIPAAILSSALSDQLRIDRESMMTELYSMLEDGVISPDEQELIEAEAKRLHLSKDELNRLLEKAKVDMGLEQSTDKKEQQAHSKEFNLEFLSKHADVAAEQLKITISKLQQIVSVSDTQKLITYFGNPNHATPLQGAMLNLLLQNSQAQPQDGLDELTGVLNKSTLMRKLDQALLSSREAGMHLAVCFIDLDHFKSINDQFGHPAGDAFLKLAAQRLGLTIRANDILARWGGDEFVLVLTSLQSQEQLKNILDRIISLFAADFEVGHVRASLGISIGIANSQSDLSSQALITRADAAMYLAKNQGGNQYHAIE